MLSTEDNRLLTQVGLGTPMGALIRRYWMPALLSEELPAADGPPARVQILGERLVAFRDTEGRVGLLQEHCPHRSASLALARNEDGGLRCIYHGWKYDAAGRCVDTPTEPATSTLSGRVRAVAYPTREVAGVVWAYLGPPEKRPVFPDFPWLKLPPAQYHAFKILEECNYAQALEGGLDHTHAAILHRPRPWGLIDPDRVVERELAAQQHIQPTRYGFRYAAVRPAGPESQLIRIINFVAPFWTTVPRDGYGASDQAGDRIVNAWVPRDDVSTWHFQYYFDPGGPVNVPWRIRVGGHQVDARYRKVRNLDNWYLQDREAMKAQNMSGLEGVVTQDHAVNETQGPILDRAVEHLGPSDLGVIAMRRSMLDAVRACMAGGDPPGLNPAVPYDQLAAATALAPASVRWQDAAPLDPDFGPPLPAMRAGAASRLPRRGRRVRHADG
ncbi:MAG: Rieske 2Fe-2S domain-containing protein [Chloroflexi bacterium]|nr:Rieske 2Fe-2S domain-containing protein [Chloroflexota bacterium]